MTDPEQPAPDVLGAPFAIRRLPLLPEASGPAHASLVRLPTSATADRELAPVLYLHGFVDYFFQAHLAGHFAAAGRDFYAVDLRAYGRSLLAHQTPNYVTDLSVYYEELDAAAAAIRADGHRRLVLMGHSTGGLIAPLWAHDRRGRGAPDGLILNSPWLELAKPWPVRTIGTPIVNLIGRLAPQTVIQKGMSDVYGRSIHREHAGEWDYSLEWKPLNAFPIRAGWLRAIRHGHARVHRGLQVDCPVLVLRSSESDLSERWSERATRSDTILDVEDMSRYGPRLGPDVRIEVVQDALHDVFLSREAARERAFAVVDRWLAERIDTTA